MSPWDKAYARRQPQEQEPKQDHHRSADLALYIVAVIAVAVMVIF